MTEAERLIKDIRDLCYQRLRSDEDNVLAGQVAHMTQQYLAKNELVVINDA